MASEKIAKEWLGFQQAGKEFQRIRTTHEHWKWITVYVRKESQKNALVSGRRTRRESRNLKGAQPAPPACISTFLLVALQDRDLNCWTVHVVSCRISPSTPLLPFINPLSFVHLSPSSLNPIILCLSFSSFSLTGPYSLYLPWMIPSPPFSNWNLVLPKDTEKFAVFFIAHELESLAIVPLASSVTFKAFVYLSSLL